MKAYKLYMVAGEVKETKHHHRPGVEWVLSRRKGGLVPVNCPVATLLFQHSELGLKFAKDWAKRSKQKVYEIEMREIL